jgi:hypothetical protein
MVHVIRGGPLTLSSLTLTLEGADPERWLPSGAAPAVLPSALLLLVGRAV